MQVNGMLLEGKKVYVGPFLKSDDRPANHELKYTNVFVKNLPENIGDDELMKMFAEHGSVTSAVVMKVCAGAGLSLFWVNPGPILQGAMGSCSERGA